MMKKILFVLVAIISVTVANAATYEVNVNLAAEQVAVIRDGQLIQGRDFGANTSVGKVELTKENGQVKVTLCELGGIFVKVSGTVDSQGNAKVFGCTLNDPRLKGAFRASMKYLNDTDKPITVRIYTNE